MPQIRPLHDLVLASRVSGETTTPGGLILSDEARKQLAHGDAWLMKAEAVGPGTTDVKGRFVATTIKPGDEFLSPPFSDFSYKIEGREVYLVPERKALAIFPRGEQPQGFTCEACGSSNCAQPTKES